MRGQSLEQWLELLRFDYRPLENDSALLRLLAELDAGRTAPASPALIVQRGQSETWCARASGSMERYRVRGVHPDAGTGLVWRASFILPLEVVELPGTLFTLTSRDHIALALPAPTLAFTELASVRGVASRRSRAGQVRRHATALAAGFAVAASFGSAVGAAAADTVSTGSGTTKAAVQSATTTTSSTTTTSTTTSSTTTKSAPPPRPAPAPPPPPPPPPPSAPSAPKAPAAPAPAAAPSTSGVRFVIPPHCPPGTVLEARLRNLHEIPANTPKPWCVSAAANPRHRSAHRRKHTRHSGSSHRAPSNGHGHDPASGGAALPPTPPLSPGRILVPTTHSAPVTHSAPATDSAPATHSELANQWSSVALDPTTAAEIAHFQSLAGGLDQPPHWLVKIYKAAARRYHVPWQILAAINAIETDYGRDLSVSSAGAVGWMQFMPETWLTYGVSADGNGRPNPYDPRDAIFSAAHYLRANGAPRHMRKAIFAYNHALWYVDAVLWRAQMISDHAFGKGGRKHGYALPLDARYMRELGRTDDGVDIETAPNGAAVYSMTPGIVTAVASDPNGFGPNYPVILVTKGPLAGQYIYYGHVAASLVKVGQHVLAGQPIAVMGHTGDAASLGHGHIEIGFSDGSGDPLNHHGASAWTPSGDAMRHVLVALSHAFKIKNS